MSTNVVRMLVSGGITISVTVELLEKSDSAIKSLCKLARSYKIDDEVRW